MRPLHLEGFAVILIESSKNNAAPILKIATNNPVKDATEACPPRLKRSEALSQGDAVVI